MGRVVLLDLDGTLLDSRPGIGASCLAALRALGHEPAPDFDVTPLIGPPMPRVMERLLRDYGDDRIEAGIAAYRAHYGAEGLFQAVLYPGVMDAVAALAARAQCFIATSKRREFALRIAEHFGLAPLLRGVYGTVPDGSLDDKSDLIAALLREEDIAPGDAVMVGDRSHDMLGARANELRAIGVLWGYGSRDELEATGADLLVAHADELPPAITD